MNFATATIQPAADSVESDCNPTQARRGWAWRGAAWLGTAGVARPGAAGHGSAWQARPGGAWRGMARHGRQGAAWQEWGKPGAPRQAPLWGGRCRGATGQQTPQALQQQAGDGAPPRQGAEQAPRAIPRRPLGSRHPHRSLGPCGCRSAGWSGGCGIS